MRKSHRLTSPGTPPRRYDKPVVVLVPLTLCPVCMGSGFESVDVRCMNCFFPSYPGYIPLHLTPEQERIAQGAHYVGWSEKGVPDRSGCRSATVPARSQAS